MTRERRETDFITPDGYEICVLCGKPTDVKYGEPIERRNNYIEGCGQLCCDCAQELNGKKRI